jgi:hypothetical protein
VKVTGLLAYRVLVAEKDPAGQVIVVGPLVQEVGFVSSPGVTPGKVAPIVAAVIRDVSATLPLMKVTTTEEPVA